MPTPFRLSVVATFARTWRVPKLAQVSSNVAILLKPLFAVTLVILATARPSSSFADDADTPTRPQRLVLIGQGPDGSHKPTSHEYFAGVNLLARLLRDQPNLETIVVSADGDWRDGPQLLARADAAVIFVSEGAKWLSADAARLAAFRDLAQRGGGLGAIHWATGTKAAEPIAPFVQLFGACHGGPDRRFQEFAEITPQLAAPEHPILRGVRPVPLREEFYFALKMTSRDAATPVTRLEKDSPITTLLRIPNDEASGTVAWCWERPDNGRSFGFTGLHYHDNWKHESYRRFMAQATLWTLKRDLPKTGLPVAVTDQDLALPATK
ncbi:MAG: ThuA domain-containing protein [Planctomycetaceae bacterium]